ncbi:hypothetical protein ACP275_14G104100 [Erythranthe tilingii]
MENLGRALRSNKGEYDEEASELNSPAVLVIKLPDSRTLRVMSLSLFLAVLFLALPSLRSASTSMMIRASMFKPAAADRDAAAGDGFKILPILLRDLVEEGLVKKGHRGLVIGATAADMEEDFEFLRDAGVDLLTQEETKADAHHVFDFVFTRNFNSMEVVDGVLKEDTGLVISPLGRDPSNGLRLLSSYKIVYLRRFESTVVAMRKMATSTVADEEDEVSCSGGGAATSEEKKAALKGLEDVYLEPPRRAAVEEKKKTSFKTSRKIKFLPDLLKDSLDEYPRRVFITDDTSAVEWFYKSYPMRDQEFEVYNVEASGAHKETGVSNWMREKVGREDYVVMKAEAQVVEEMLKEKTLCLVDELFLECKNQWQDDEDQSDGSKRAYWQCLALYGKVRDEGIAVHQWWD